MAPPSILNPWASRALKRALDPGRKGLRARDVCFAHIITLPFTSTWNMSISAQPLLPPYQKVSNALVLVCNFLSGNQKYLILFITLKAGRLSPLVQNVVLWNVFGCGLRPPHASRSPCLYILGYPSLFHIIMILLLSSLGREFGSLKTS